VLELAQGVPNKEQPKIPKLFNIKDMSGYCAPAGSVYTTVRIRQVKIKGSVKSGSKYF
jgi:hypothetical protein